MMNDLAVCLVSVTLAIGLNDELFRVAVLFLLLYLCPANSVCLSTLCFALVVISRPFFLLLFFYHETENDESTEND